MGPQEILTHPRSSSYMSLLLSLILFDKKKFPEKKSDLKHGFPVSLFFIPVFFRVQRNGEQF